MHWQPAIRPLASPLLVTPAGLVGERVDKGLGDVADPDVAVLGDTGEVAEGGVLGRSAARTYGVIRAPFGSRQAETPRVGQWYRDGLRPTG